MANTITKNNSFGEVLDALKLKGVKARLEKWDNSLCIYYEENNSICYLDTEDNSDDEYYYPSTREMFAEDWIIVYPN